MLREHVVRRCRLSDGNGGGVDELVQLREEPSENEERHVLAAPVRCVGAQHVDVGARAHTERPGYLDDVVQTVFET